MTMVQSRQLDFTDTNGESIAPPLAPHPLAILHNAVQHNVPVETLERLTALAERWQANQAQQTFAEALAGFQREMPPITKARKTDRFAYAGFDDIMKVASPILAKHNISVGFDSTQSDKGLSVTCRVRVGSYHEDRTFAVPIPASLKVSEPQQFGAALQYAKRYSICAALNIVVTDEDNEARLEQFITPEQKTQLAASLKEAKRDASKFLTWAGAATLEEVTVRRFNEYMGSIRVMKHTAPQKD